MTERFYLPNHRGFTLGLETQSISVFGNRLEGGTASFTVNTAGDN